MYLLLDRPDADAAQALDLLRRKEIRATVGPAQMAANWRQAQQEVNDDLRSIYCTRQVEPRAIEEMLAQLQFDPLLPQQESDHL